MVGTCQARLDWDPCGNTKQKSNCWSLCWQGPKHVEYHSSEGFIWQQDEEWQIYITQMKYKILSLSITSWKNKCMNRNIDMYEAGTRIGAYGTKDR